MVRPVSRPSCPYLGIKHDRESFISFASRGNCCFRTGRPVRVKLEYQDDVCLVEQYNSCPVYKGEGRVTLNREHREPDITSTRIARFWAVRLISIVILFGLAAAAYYYWPSLQPRLFPHNSLEQVESTYIAPTYLVNSPPEEEYKPIISTLEKPQSVAQAAQTPSSATITSTPEEDEITNGKSLLVHKLVQGDSLDQLSEKFYTTNQAILDINYKLAPPLMEGKTIVIPEGIIDTGSLPQFEVKNIPEKVKVILIVKKFGCDLELFKKYNHMVIVTSFEEDYVLSNHWVIIPRERKIKQQP